MIRNALILIALLTLGTIPAIAQEKNRGEITRGQLEPVPAAPILQGDMMSNEAATAIFKQCRSFYPRRFTPGALDSYCECAVTATQVSLTAKEYSEIQIPKNQKATNPVYQKYITMVVAPCLDLPSADIEYLGCALDRYADSRISNLPKYCQCVSREIQSHVSTFGDVDIMITMSTNQQVTDPFEALWMNPKYIEATRNARTSCLGHYMKNPIKFSYN